MIYIILGTRAQLVKMAPVILKLEEMNLPLTLIHTGQHKESFFDLCNNFQIKSPWHSLYNNNQEVKTITHALKWLTRILSLIAISPAALLPKYILSNKNIILVHGDTFSTIVGALIGKRLGIKVAHIESGLRSFHLLNPFPEEINRLLTFHLVDIAFCPGQWALNNLEKYEHLEKINTQNNTLLDSLNFALNSPQDSGYLIPETEYGIVSIHRFENIFFTKQLKLIVEQLIKVSKHYPLIFVLHPATLKRLKKSGLINRLNNANIELRERTSYTNFVKLLCSSTFVITDGGSNQEELSYLNIPTFLMRKRTERQEGLQTNIILGNLSDVNLINFIENLKTNTHRIIPAPHKSPTSYICEAIVEYGI